MIRVVVDDVGFLAADAIVRPATTRLDPTAAALRRLETMGGAEFHDRLRLTRDLPVGAAVVTAAGGDLPAEFVIHTVIRSETEQQAQEWQFAHLSVPPIGTGAGNLTIEDAAEIMATVLHVHLENSTFPADVSFVVETPEEHEVFEAALRRAAAAGET